MKTFKLHDGERRDANPSLEQMEGDTKPFQDPTKDEAFEGSEFLDDALRMHEQPLVTDGAHEGE